jgi:hypothetical protein
MRCSQCGHEIPAGKAFCAACGAATGAARPPSRGAQPGPRGAQSAPRGARPASHGARPVSRAPAPASASPPSGRGVSVWWIIGPTLFYGLIALNLVNTVILAAIGALLKFAQSRSEVPAGVRPFLPLIQPAAVFVFLGGSIIPVAVAGAFGVLAVQQRDALVQALEPWWRIQRQLPARQRSVIGFVLSLAIGYLFGGVADGREWTITFISVSIGTLVMFLFSFSPPAAVRLTRNVGPGRKEA